MLRIWSPFSVFFTPFALYSILVTKMTRPRYTDDNQNTNEFHVTPLSTTCISSFYSWTFPRLIAATRMNDIKRETSVRDMFCNCRISTGPFQHSRRWRMSAQVVSTCLGERRPLIFSSPSWAKLSSRENPRDTNKFENF